MLAGGGDDIHLSAGGDAAMGELGFCALREYRMWTSRGCGGWAAACSAAAAAAAPTREDEEELPRAL